MTAERTPAAVLRVLRRLSASGSRLRRVGAGYRFVRDGKESAEPVAPAAVEELARRDLAIERDGEVVLTEAGMAFLRRALADAGEPYRAQHQDAETASVTDEGGTLRQVTVNRAESPLAALRHRRGRDGRPLIDVVQYAAGERLRADFERGRLTPRVTANWSAAVAAGRRDGGAGGMAELTAAALTARRRVERAIEALGPELAGPVLDACCFLKGLEEIERERKWPARSAKLVLRLGLGVLARHYGLAGKAHGNARSAGIVHWGTEDYRPSIE